MPCRGVFLTGTDTDVGKTYVGCVIARTLVENGFRVGAYKPVASGFPSWEGSDGQRLWDATSRLGSPDLVSPQRFREPFAPSVAAAMEGCSVDESKIFSGLSRMASQCELLMVEGAGGLLSPISPRLTNADLVAHLAIPAVLVANWKLGVVHQVLASLTAAHVFNIHVAAVVLSAADGTPPHPTHQQLLAEFLRNRCNSDRIRESPQEIHSEDGPIDSAWKSLPKQWSEIPVLTLRHNQTTFEERVEWSGLFASIRSATT